VDVETGREGCEDPRFHDHERAGAVEEKGRSVGGFLQISPDAQLEIGPIGLIGPILPFTFSASSLSYFPSYEPEPVSPLLLLRPALHWEGRSGDGLSACCDDVALKTRFLKPAINPRRIGGRFFYA